MRALEPLQEQPEWLRVSLSSIGDAVILSFLKPGGSVPDWLETRDAARKPLDAVFKTINEGYPKWICRLH
jgi:hypothetical protein